MNKEEIALELTKIYFQRDENYNSKERIKNAYLYFLEIVNKALEVEE